MNPELILIKRAEYLSRARALSEKFNGQLTYAQMYATLAFTTITKYFGSTQHLFEEINAVRVYNVPEDSERSRDASRDAEITRMISEGMTLKQMAVELHVSRERVRQLLNVLGLRTSRVQACQARIKILTAEDMARAVNMREHGIKMREIMQVFPSIHVKTLYLALAKIKRKFGLCLKCGVQTTERDKRLGDHTWDLCLIHSREKAASRQFERNKTPKAQRYSKRYRRKHRLRINAYTKLFHENKVLRAALEAKTS